ncbi:Uncharacterized protein HZ326_9517 [Fusarium oxysporum f. sp. albedinis]|nr:Uncharacterized protein HZ326_9517 [Fusarium oxysporum f. sp. albedinis]
MTLERRRTRMSKTEADPTSKLDYSTELICLKTAPSSSWKAGVSLPHAVLQNGYVYCTLEKLRLVAGGLQIADPEVAFSWRCGAAKHAIATVVELVICLAEKSLQYIDRRTRLLACANMSEFSQVSSDKQRVLEKYDTACKKSEALATLLDNWTQARQRGCTRLQRWGSSHSTWRQLEFVLGLMVGVEVGY